MLRPRQILLCRISRHVPEWVGRWTRPGGGIEFGEDPEAGTIREVTLPIVGLVGTALRLIDDRFAEVAT